MAREKPRDYKHPEHNIAKSGKAEIFETFSKLLYLSVDMVNFDFTRLTGKTRSIKSISIKIKWPTLVWW